MSGCFCTGKCQKTGFCPNNRSKMADRNEEGLPIIPPLVKPPSTPADGAIDICGECGIRLTPVMGYSCPNSNCPVFPRGTC